VREWELVSSLERTDRFCEHLARHAISGVERVLRVYPFGPLADEAERRRVEERCRWEAQVLARIGQHPWVLDADPPFLDEAGICLPLEAFSGITLASWIDRHAKTLSGKRGLELRVAVFDRIAQAIEHAHAQGIVHRLLRPECILLENKAEAPDLRVTGFDLAKQLHSNQTVGLTTVHDERLRWAAPEVAQGFSNATPLSDQFALGALLGLLIASKPLFDSTAELLRLGGRVPPLRDLNPAVPQSYDTVVARMLSLRPADRFASLAEARAALARVLEGKESSAEPR
ncbi:MAG TPA: hypothetical protein DFS52_31685, partial [Myxococcales bacterium]|nr:hypothetical protein [Myxococcales bacterium]